MSLASRHISREIDERDGSMCRKKPFLCFCICLMLLAVAGCGVKDEQDVVSELAQRTEKMESYISHGKMTILTSSEPQVYDIEVWYKKPSFYRVSIKNVKKNITQIILRNDEGVFVLTPHLKKSFRFQSDWPQTNGQIYLYQSIIQSIIDDEERMFQAEKKTYQLEVSAKYPFNQEAAKQKIWLDSKLLPTRLEVLSEQNQKLMQVQFDRFQLDASFDDDAFDTERNMKDLPSAEKQVVAPADPEKNELASVLPGYIPEKSHLVSEQTIQTPDGPVQIMRFQGEKSFTLTQRKPQAVATSLPLMGKPVELKSAIGVLLESGEMKRLAWTYQGMEFEMIGKLAEEEMVKIANSTFDQLVK
jgi:outer membrane lipoprotein-sorting protein